MAVKGTMFVALLAGTSVAGAYAGLHRDAIVEKATVVFEQFSGVSLEAIFRSTPPNPVIAMTDAPLESVLPFSPTDGKELLLQSFTQETAWSVPKISDVSKTMTPFSEALPADDKPQIGEFSKAPVYVAELGKLGSVEVMKSAAKQRDFSQPSQLDVILSAMPPMDKEQLVIANAAVKTPESDTVPAQDKKVERVAAENLPIAQSEPVLRPVARPEARKKIAERPSFSAKHYHNLRFHLSGHGKKKSKIACIAELQLIASYTQVYFDKGSSRLDDRGASAARLIAAKVQSCPEAQLSIIGFTDPGGAKDVNQRISWSRANSVFSSIKEAGFAMQNIEVSSHMEDHPDYCVHFEGIDRRVVFDVREAPKG